MTDDYKDEFLLRLEQNEIYYHLKKKCANKDNEVLALVNKAVYYAYQRTKTIVKHMGEFTLHDGDHLFKVLYLMEKLLPKETLSNLHPPELMLLILSAFFHDIGMAPSEKEVLAWRKVWDIIPDFDDEREEITSNEFKRFYTARPEQQEIIEQLILQGKNTDAETQKAYLISEYIRKTHAERAKEIISNDWNNKIIYRDTDLTVEFAQLCYSHNEDALSLLDLDKKLLCAADTYICLPLLGVILRLADLLDFDAKRTPAVLFSHLFVRHPTSIKEWNRHRAIDAWEINPELIQFNAKCKHPAIESSINEFCNTIDHELSACNNIITTLNEFNKKHKRDIPVKFPYKMSRDKIRTQRDIHNKPLYIYRDTKFNLSKKQVIDLLMGTKLYGNPEVALRELLQNSIDACLLRAAQEKKWGNTYHPEILVKYYLENEDILLEVEDNGTGMDQYIVDNYYSNIGSSFYKSTDFYNLKSESNANFTPTSRFGIGILSCFMVADSLIVDTKRVYKPHKSSDAINITVEGQESIFWIRNGQRETPGTTTKLILRKAKNPWDKMTEEEFIKSVDLVIPNPPFTIHIQTTSQNKVKDQNSFNSVTSSSLKDSTWDTNENLRVFEIKLNKNEIGILGSATVAILGSNEMPVSEIELNSRDVEVEGNIYTLEKEVSISENKISESSKSITINDDGEISKYESSSDLARSKSRLSLHGIEVPTTLFPNTWNMKNNQVKISWPFPLILVVDICGNRDLDLNSSRTEIIMSDKWINFEEELAFIICSEIAKTVSNEYWDELHNLFSQNTKNDTFLRGLNKVKKTT